MKRPATPLSPASGHEPAARGSGSRPAEPHEYVLVVDDDPAVRHLLGAQLEHLGYAVRAAASGEEALTTLRRHPHPELILTDLQMPGLGGVELLDELQRFNDSLQVVMISGHHDLDTMRDCLRRGAYDYLVKPYELNDLAISVERAVEHSRLLRQNEEYRRNLERMVLERTAELRATRDVALITLAKLAESRDSDTGFHLERMAAYSRRLAEELRQGPYSRDVSASFIELLYRSSPLHDIGKVGINDAILRKPGPLTPEETAVMQTHTTIGGDTLRQVIERQQGHGFLVMGMEIAYSHHERWDGSGYPAGLGGRDIPLPARIVALADAYDAITSARPYKPAYDHDEAVQRITGDSGRHFDPQLVSAFDRCRDEFAAIHRRLHDAPAAAPARERPR